MMSVCCVPTISGSLSKTGYIQHTGFDRLTLTIF
jgi:hypothetical protein